MLTAPFHLGDDIIFETIWGVKECVSGLIEILLVFSYHSTIFLNKHSDFSNKMRDFLLAVSCVTFIYFSYFPGNTEISAVFSKVSKVPLFKN
jgi:hypothetical protein